MSYIAKGTGDIYFLLLKEDARKGLHSILCSTQSAGSEQARSGEVGNPANWLETGLSAAGFSILTCKEINAPGLYHVSLSYQGDYEEYQMAALLDALAPFTAEGCISYVGEDGALWRFLFQDESWVEQYGEIRYSTPDSSAAARLTS